MRNILIVFLIFSIFVVLFYVYQLGQEDKVKLLNQPQSLKIQLPDIKL
jgi:hypothetical protein